MPAEIKRYYCPDCIARRLGSQIPTGAGIAVVRFLPKRHAVIEAEVHTLITLVGSGDPKPSITPFKFYML